MEEPQGRQRQVLIGVAAVTIIVAIVLAIVVIGGGDDDDPDTTTTSSTTTSSTATTSTTLAVTSTAVPAGEVGIALYPDLRTTTRFTEPRDLVEAFATQLLGFDTDVVIGELQQGDNRSGEIEIHPPGSSAITTIAVRQVQGDSWVVVAATTDSIKLTTPVSGTRISSPQPLLGAASAFEGHVDVTLFVDGDITPAATTFVTGRGDGELGDFSGQLKFTVPAGTTHGVIVLSSPNGDDGTSTAAVAIRVKF